MMIAPVWYCSFWEHIGYRCNGNLDQFRHLTATPRVALVFSAFIGFLKLAFLNKVIEGIRAYRNDPDT
jgi:hypothetical protein